MCGAAAVAGVQRLQGRATAVHARPREPSRLKLWSIPATAHACSVDVPAVHAVGRCGGRNRQEASGCCHGAALTAAQSLRKWELLC